MLTIPMSPKCIKCLLMCLMFSGDYVTQNIYEDAPLCNVMSVINFEKKVMQCNWCGRNGKSKSKSKSKSKGKGQGSRVKAQGSRAMFKDTGQR